ncbi:helix-turn-helix domain-containing protein [Carnobacterium mobile]|nr:helix-turn-helix transcriptional regulator [Carnobacterium mobile]
MEISHGNKKRRTELNITQEELAERLNVTRAAVFKLGK